MIDHFWQSVKENLYCVSELLTFWHTVFPYSELYKKQAYGM